MSNSILEQYSGAMELISHHVPKFSPITASVSEADKARTSSFAIHQCNDPSRKSMLHKRYEHITPMPNLMPIIKSLLMISGLFDNSGPTVFSPLQEQQIMGMQTAHLVHGSTGSNVAPDGHSHYEC